MICGSGGSKVGSLKRQVRSQQARWEMKNCTPLWREAHLQVKMYKAPGSRNTFGSWDVEKVHAVVAGSTFPSQTVQNTPRSDHFWKLRCRKSACRCGAKHISKWKCAKHTSSGPLLEVKMSKKCTPLWHEAHSKSKCTKHTMYGPFLEVQISFRVAGARDCGLCQKWAKREGFVAFLTTTTTTLHYTPIHCTTLPLQLQLHLHYILLHYTALNYTQLHYITLHYTTLRYTTLHYTTLHYTTLPSTTLHYITLHSTTLQLQLQLQLHSTTLHYTNYTTLLRYTTLHYTTFHDTPLHYTTSHYTTLHWMTLHHR